MTRSSQFNEQRFPPPASFTVLVEEQHARSELERASVHQPNLLAKMAEAGDVTELVNYIRTHRLHCLGPGDLLAIRRALCKADISSLIQSGFAEMIRLITELIFRSNLSIERRLSLADRFHPGCENLLPDLTEELERYERLARFFTEIATTHARICHVRAITDRKQGIEDDQATSNDRCAVGSAVCKTRKRKAAPRKGRGVRAETGVLGGPIPGSNGRAHSAPNDLRRTSGAR